MKIDLSGKLTDFEGNVIGQSLGKILAASMMNSSTGDSLKMLCLAEKLNEDKELDLDDSDLKTLKEFTGGQNQMNNLMKGKILRILNK